MHEDQYLHEADPWHINAHATFRQSFSTIHISGIIPTFNQSNPNNASALTLQIINSKNNILTVDQLTPKTSGTYSTSINADGQMWNVDGDYTVKVNYAGQSASTTFAFTIPNPVTTTSQPQPSAPTSGVAGMEWIMILIPVIIIVGVVIAIKSRKKTPRAAPQRKTFGAKQPRKRRTIPNVPVQSSVDGPSTYGYFECPNCHEPSAPQGKLRQNPDGSQFCTKCGWRS